MDQCTHEIRLQYWKNIISLCHERPSGQTAKQWLKENGICEQTYYSWQRKIWQESYDSMQVTSKVVLPSVEENEISFSDISYSISNVLAEVDPADCNDRSDAESVEAIRPVAVIKWVPSWWSSKDAVYGKHSDSFHWSCHHQLKICQQYASWPYIKGFPGE